MNSQQIEYFLSAAKHLNFTKAADEFYTFQPTISRQIALLEEELGFELFKRDKGNLRLTVGGIIMAQEFAKTNKIIRDAITKVGLVSEGLEGEISIGFVRGTNNDSFVYPPTVEFMEEYPAINVMIESTSFSKLRKNLESGEYDIIFTFDFELSAIPNASHMRCYTVPTIIAMSSSHPLAGKENLTPQDFSGETFLFPRALDSSGGRSEALSVLSEIGVKDIKPRSMSGIESLMFGVRSGIGVALLDASLDLIFDNRYSYFQLPAGHHFSTLDIMAVWKKDNLNPTVPVYLEKLRENLGLDS